MRMPKSAARSETVLPLTSLSRSRIDSTLGISRGSILQLISSQVMIDARSSLRSPQATKVRARSWSLQTSQEPRTFAYGESFLAQCAADAYKTNAAYNAIEKETLHAVAPFLELHKREDSDNKHEAFEMSSPFRDSKTQAYLHKQDDSSSSQLVSSEELIERHQRNSSASSVSFEDFRKHAQTVPNEFSAYRERNSRILARRMTTSGIYPKLALNDEPNAVEQRLDKPVPHCSSVASHSMLRDCSSLSARDQMLKEQFQALTLYNNRDQQAIVPQVPDPAFTLTKYVLDVTKTWTPSSQELSEKLHLQQSLETILQAIQPTASLIIFGSLSSGLAIANSDMDLMVVDNCDDPLHDLKIDLPALMFEALKAQGYAVRHLSKARIPVVKIHRDYSGGAFCVDISFDNQLALHNTRLIATYAACDPRISSIIRFVKIWARARKVNDSLNGTLNSYGYMLMLIYFLQNKTTPALLPNLQMIASANDQKVTTDELECNGFDVWYFKNVAKIIPIVQQNTQSIGELVEGFFSHFAYEFDYRDWVISIRLPGGLQTKDGKNWTQMIEHVNGRGDGKIKDRYILSIEDPFEITNNVARSVTRSGLYEIRGEFMHGVRCIRGNKLSELAL